MHSELLSIMAKVNQVCEVNKLKYYLVGGSLLGAIRHNGFIPWDDDSIKIIQTRYQTRMQLSPR